MQLLYPCIGFSFVFFVGYLYLLMKIDHPQRPRSHDDYEKCLFRLGHALDDLKLRWFITYGTALNYWRSKKFTGSDMDTAIFYEDYRARNLTEKEFLLFLKNKYQLKLTSHYGQIKHGKEWTFACVEAKISVDIFLVYRYNETKYSFKYWAASYNDLCDKMIYGKCRWGFSDFNLTQVNVHGKDFQIVPLSFIIERYGQDYREPKRYNYFQSLRILPNLIKEYKEK